MSESLKDQLQALGLASKRSVGKSSKPKKTRAKAGHRPASAKPRDADVSLGQAYRMRNQQERQQKEQAIALKREQDRQRREVNQKIKALVKAHKVRDEAAENKRSFIYKGRIRSVLVNADQLQDINSGKLGVVYLSGNYHLLPTETVEEIRQFAADHVPDLKGSESEGEEDNPVPDDLTW